MEGFIHVFLCKHVLIFMNAVKVQLMASGRTANAGGSCPHYRDTDPRILAQLPEHVRMQFPVMITGGNAIHKSAVSWVLEAMSTSSSVADAARAMNSARRARREHMQLLDMHTAVALSKVWPAIIPNVIFGYFWGSPDFVILAQGSRELSLYTSQVCCCLPSRHACRY